MSNPKTFAYKLLTSLGYKVIILDEEGEEYKSLPEDFGGEVIQLSPEAEKSASLFELQKLQEEIRSGTMDRYLVTGPRAGEFIEKLKGMKLEILVSDEKVEEGIIFHTMSYTVNSPEEVKQIMQEYIQLLNLFGNDIQITPYKAS